MELLAGLSLAGSVEAVLYYFHSLVPMGYGKPVHHRQERLAEGQGLLEVDLDLWDS